MKKTDITSSPKRVPAGPGTVVPAGPGKVVSTGDHTGHWKTFDAAAGLVGGGVWSILQDRQGNIWFGGHGGVVRYDGRTFTRFVPEDGLPGSPVLCIVQDRQDDLWFSTYEGGVRRYDGKIWSRFTKKDGLANDHVWRIFEDCDGCLWFGTKAGVSRYDGESWTTFTTEDGLAYDSVGCVFQERDGCFWFCTSDYEHNGKGVTRYDPGAEQDAWVTFTTADGLADNNVWCGIQSRDGNLWFTTNNGVSCFDGETWQTFTTEDGLAHNSVWSVFQDREGNLWFSTAQGGASRFDGRNWKTFTTQDGMAYNLVVSAFQDREGYLWFGTHGGASRYDAQTLTSYTTAHGLPTNIYSILQDRDGIFWFGTMDGGLVRYDGETWAIFTAEDGLPSNRIDDVCQDREGNLWFATHGGACCYDGETFRTFETEDGLVGNEVMSIVQDRSGAMWFGTERVRAGVGRYDGQAFTNFTAEDGLEGEWVYQVLEDRDGHLWITSNLVGITRYDGETFTTFTEVDGLASNWTWSILQDRDGCLWFGFVDSGVSCYDGHSFTTITPEDGLGDVWVRSMLQDRNGHLWFGTAGGGVNRFDGKTFQTLTEGDGLAGNTVISIFEDRNGDLWFGTNKGITRYRQPDPMPPLVYIHAVVGDRRYEEVSEVTLSNRVGLISFEFHGVSLKTRPGAMVYRYRLQGRDADWTDTREERVEYENLPVGRYTFEVLAIDRDLVYSEESASVDVHVTPDPRMEGLVAALSSSGTDEFVGGSQALRRVQAELAEGARTDVTVLIQGETGTGKGLAARAVHGLSDRKGGPFIQVNCGAIPEGLVESELFGHEKGSFTGAVSRKLGKVELAAGGTLFLDEIGDMALSAQVKLLRLLEERTFERVGGTEVFQADARVIAATNRDLMRMVSEGHFREDLYYRLHAFPVQLPSLRERREDIDLLGMYFMNRMAGHLRKVVVGFTPDALDVLRSYAWPGNVRELEHAVQRAVIVCRGNAIRAGDLALGHGTAAPPEGEIVTLEDVERRHILTVLEQTNWVVAGNKGAAARLGLNASTLRSRMKKLGIVRG